MDSLLKSKINYDKLIQNRLNYKNNKLMTEIFNSPKKEKNKKMKNLRYNKMAKFNENKSHKSPKKKEIEEDNEDNKLLSEKVKYETQLHNKY